MKSACAKIYLHKCISTCVYAKIRRRQMSSFYSRYTCNSFTANKLINRQKNSVLYSYCDSSLLYSYNVNSRFYSDSVRNLLYCYRVNNLLKSYSLLYCQNVSSLLYSYSGANNLLLNCVSVSIFSVVKIPC